MHNPFSRSVSVALSLDTRALQWLTDAHGHPYYLNRQWYDYTGLTADELKEGTWVQVGAAPLDGGEFGLLS